jgi:hypothetical protein
VLGQGQGCVQDQYQPNAASQTTAPTINFGDTLSDLTVCYQQGSEYFQFQYQNTQTNYSEVTRIYIFADPRK